MTISSHSALERLKSGNQRFLSEVQEGGTLENQTRRNKLVLEQSPFAVILGCSDARVPAEIIFDQGLGDLFVIRVAGNIVAPSQIGSVEFSVTQFHTPLVIVLGHTQCGAITTTVQTLIHSNRTTQHPPSLNSIVERIRPAVEVLLENKTTENISEEKLIQQAGRANIRASVNQLKHSSELLEKLVLQNQLKIIGAEYNISTGEVVFFDY